MHERCLFLPRTIGRWLIGLLALAVTTVAAEPVAAQTAPAEAPLLDRVPNDFALCLTVRGLRPRWARLKEQAWWQAWTRSPVGKELARSPEFQALGRIEQDVKQHLGIDFATLRDDFLGEETVFAYRPPQGGNGEQGLFLTRARDAAVLTKLVDRLNEVQRQSGELMGLEQREHRGAVYFRRVYGASTHWYALVGRDLVVASDEGLLKRALAPIAPQSAVRAALRRADADDAVAALWLNPRAIAAEQTNQAKPDNGLAEQLLKALWDRWKTVEAVVVTLSLAELLELRLTMLAGSAAPPAAKDGSGAAAASELWRRFPADAVAVVAGKVDVKGLVEGFHDLAPAELRKSVSETIRKTLGAALGLDPFTEVVPNVGPDAGVCLLSAQAGRQFPQLLAAVAVRPGNKDPAVDQAVFRAVQFFAGLAIFEYNRGRPDEARIRLRSQQQGDVEVKFLVQERVFPAGFQPACALKSGYLLLATSPAAIEPFAGGREPHPATALLPPGEVPLAYLAPGQLAQLLNHHRSFVLHQLTAQQGQTMAEAVKTMDNTLATLRLCRSLTLSQFSGDGRYVLVLRLQPAAE
ncbi:MAG: DUF3352 domain-containing protein [Gemmataceae bacterium]|nr:DUF3352 domain-containing protein [Gemmataceae bacterium]